VNLSSRDVEIVFVLNLSKKDNKNWSCWLADCVGYNSDIQFVFGLISRFTRNAVLIETPLSNPFLIYDFLFQFEKNVTEFLRFVRTIIPHILLSNSKRFCHNTSANSLVKMGITSHAPKSSPPLSSSPSHLFF